MSLKLGMTGMDTRTQQSLSEAFQAANAVSGWHFELVADGQADFVIVDMDSLYGPMSFMQLHNAGKHVIGYTQAPRTNADSRLGRPLVAAEFARLLEDLAAGRPTAAAPAPAPASPPAPAPAPARGPVTAPPPAAAPAAPAPVAAMPAAVPEHLPPASLHGATPAPSPQDHLYAMNPPAPSQQVTAPPLPVNVAPEPARIPTLADWLAPGALPDPVRLQRGSGPELLINPQKREYRGPNGLKPLIEYFAGPMERAEFGPVTDADWLRTAGNAQPLARLVWLAGLLAGNGKLVDGIPAAAEFKLNKWPQTEREYPKHFRIATAMMKGPATISQIAEAASVPTEDVADFVNASLATGFAEANVGGAPVALPGVLGMLRGG